jgi:hypothetical protein
MSSTNDTIKGSSKGCSNTINEKIKQEESKAIEENKAANNEKKEDDDYFSKWYDKDDEYYPADPSYYEDDYDPRAPTYSCPYGTYVPWYGTYTKWDKLYDEVFHPNGETNFSSPDALEEVANGYCEPEWMDCMYEDERDGK